MTRGLDGDVVYHGYLQPPGGGRPIIVETPDGEQLGVVRHVVKHSPTGMGWGYGGSGPADCARSLLIAAIGERAECEECRGSGRVVYTPSEGKEPVTAPYDESIGDEPYIANDLEIAACWQADCDRGYRIPPAVYQAFKQEHVATWRGADGHPVEEWSMHRSEILAWLDNLAGRNV